MAKRKMRSPVTGEMATASVVDIEEIRDKPMVVELADKTTLRIRVDIIEVMRLDNQWDANGDPVYHINTKNYASVIESPNHLKKGDVKKITH